MSKIKNSVWYVFGESVKLYFLNFFSFIKYMSFPVLGQVLGLFLSLWAVFIYAENIPKLIVNGGFFDNFSVIFLVLLVVILPGLLIFAKAFWDYLVAYGAVNSMVDGLLKSGKIYDFPAHTEVITRKSGKYILLWFLIGLLILLGNFPIFWIIAFIMFIYFILVFQIFVYEPDKSVFGCFQRSVEVIKGNFARTLGLLFLVWLTTYILIPKLITTMLDMAAILTFISQPFDPWMEQLPLEQANMFFMSWHLPFKIIPLGLAKMLVSSFLWYIITCYTLPLRTICWALWYKKLYVPQSQIDKKLLDRAEGKN